MFHLHPRVPVPDYLPPLIPRLSRNLGRNHQKILVHLRCIHDLEHYSHVCICSRASPKQHLDLENHPSNRWLDCQPHLQPTHDHPEGQECQNSCSDTDAKFQIDSWHEKHVCRGSQCRGKDVQTVSLLGLNQVRAQFTDITNCRPSWIHGANGLPSHFKYFIWQMPLLSKVSDCLPEGCILKEHFQSC